MSSQRFRTINLPQVEGHVPDLITKTFVCGMFVWQTLTELRSEIDKYRSHPDRKAIDD